MMTMISQIFILLIIVTMCITKCEGARAKLIGEDVKHTTSSSTKLIAEQNEGKVASHGKKEAMANIRNNTYSQSTTRKVKHTGSLRVANTLPPEFAGIAVHGSGMQNVHAKLAIFAPGIVPSGTYSSAFVSVEAGEGPTYNRIEVGWTVNPAYYGDNQIRVNLYSMGNNYKTCHDSECLILNSETSGINFGDVLTPSKLGYDPQSLLDIYIEQNETLSSVWNVEVNSRRIGYFNGETFSGLAAGATKIKIGGKVFTPWDLDSCPPMGSGRFSNGWRTVTSYAEGITIDGNVPQNPEIVETRCYYVGDVGITNYLEGFGFFFGGKGGKDQVRCVY